MMRAPLQMGLVGAQGKAVKITYGNVVLKVPAAGDNINDGADGKE